VYSADGELIGEFFLQKRVLVPLARIPLHVQNAFISAEDRRFWEHPGFDLAGIARAAWANWASSATRQGASTITQQVTRMLLLSNERTYSRKIKELILSVRVERELSKRNILEIYLNHAYLGHGAYGVQAAAEAYFGKSVEHLTVAEAAMLAGLTQAPTRYSPLHNLRAARARQHYVLGRMRADGFIDDRALRDALAEPIALIDTDVPLNHVAAPYFVEHVRRWAQSRYGHRDLFHGGLRIDTTLDMKIQQSAEAAVRDGLEELERQIGFRGPLRSLAPAELDEFSEGPAHPYVPGYESARLTNLAELMPDIAYVGAVVERGQTGVTVDVGPRSYPMNKEDVAALLRWKGERGRVLAVGDLVPVKLGPPDDRGQRRELILAQNPQVQAATVVIDPHTGKVRAMVGGYDYRQSQFNRATQARRQIGSAIKPFIYATALASGMTHLDVVHDGPITVRTAGGAWSPGNFDNKFLGPVTLRTAMAKSLNTVSVRLVMQTGIDPVVELMRALGITSPVPRHITVSLGTPDFTLLEVTAAQAAFANGGLRVDPRFIELVTGDDGTVLEDHRHRRPNVQAIPRDLAYLITHLMKAVVERGTGRGAQELGRPVAGKTGTSTGHRDAWFFGYTTDLIGGVWVGRDDFTPIWDEATGGVTALPIWLRMMKAGHPNTLVRDFAPPDNITFVRANEMNGLPAPAGASDATWVPFARGTVPRRFTSSIQARRFSGLQ
jgi:penicillin-binding protein 1A